MVLKSTKRVKKMFFENLIAGARLKVLPDQLVRRLEPPIGLPSRAQLSRRYRRVIDYDAND